MAQPTALTVARRKKTEGVSLTAEEERAFRAYVRRHVKLSLKVYFESEAQMEAMRKQAKDAGAPSFSSWFLENARLGASGRMVDPEVLEQLQRQIEKARGDYEHERTLGEEYRQKARQLEIDFEALRRKSREDAEHYAEKLEQYNAEYKAMIRQTREEHA